MTSRIDRILAWMMLSAQSLIILTGALVRLTGSGLGCPTWPRCTADSLTPHGELTMHSAIEFGNRLLGVSLGVLGVVTILLLLRRFRTRPDLVWFAVGLTAIVPVQAVIGGVTVLTGLNPWVVAGHFVPSAAAVVVSVLFVRRTYRFGRSLAPCRIAADARPRVDGVRPHLDHRPPGRARHRCGAARRRRAERAQRPGHAADGPPARRPGLGARGCDPRDDRPHAAGRAGKAGPTLGRSAARSSLLRSWSWPRASSGTCSSSPVCPRSWWHCTSSECAQSWLRPPGWSTRTTSGRPSRRDPRRRLRTANSAGRPPLRPELSGSPAAGPDDPVRLPMTSGVRNMTNMQC